MTIPTIAMSRSEDYDLKCVCHGSHRENNSDVNRDKYSGLRFSPRGRRKRMPRKGCQRRPPFDTVWSSQTEGLLFYCNTVRSTPYRKQVISVHKGSTNLECHGSIGSTLQCDCICHHNEI